MFSRYPASMNRTEALDLLKAHVKNENMVKHCLASEAVMEALAGRLDKNKEQWPSQACCTTSTFEGHSFIPDAGGWNESETEEHLRKTKHT